MARSASRCAIASKNGCRIPAPAPWASTYNQRAPGGRISRPDTRGPPSPTVIVAGSLETSMELLQRAHEIGLLLEHRAERVVLQLFHARRRVRDRELPDVELGRHLAPREPHRHRRAG